MNSTDHLDASIVLVHAAWADASSWNKVILPLRDRGWKVLSAQIPLTSLSDDLAALRRVVERTSGPVVLAGHSYAGAVITALEHDRVKALVYIAAMAPERGETVGELFYREPPHAQAPPIAPDEYGFIWMPEEGFRSAVAPNASTDEAILMAVTQRPISVQCLSEPLPAAMWKSKPSWFLLAEEDRMISPKMQRFMAERAGATIHSYPVDHTPLLTAPQLVVNMVQEAIHATLPR
jgi:pimeloyl-ACP methyl ester carboxylesterase